MGSKLQAHRAAARIAIEKLHRAGELDNLFFPIPSIDSDDEDTKKEKENPSSGTERRHWLYRNEVIIMCGRVNNGGCGFTILLTRYLNLSVGVTPCPTRRCSYMPS